MAKQKGSAPEIPVADQLIDMAKTAMKLFHSQDGRPYAVVHREGRSETHEIGGEKFALLLSRMFYRATGRTIAKSALETVVRHLSAFALLDGPKMMVYNRVALCREGIAVDLADESWRAIVVTVGKWELVSGAALFSRNSAQCSLPEPVSGGSIDELRVFIPVKSNDDWYLLVVWVVKCFIPRGPYPLLEINGLPGSAKTIRTRLLVSFIDPHLGVLQAFPKEERNLFISAKNSHVLSFDNVSQISDALSDCLCRLATGGGFRIRRNYTDTDETIIDVCRPVIINGINRVCLQQDLIDRSIQITVPPITQEQRQTEEELLTKFEEAKPRILGAFMTLLAAVLGEIGNVTLDVKPRMADFARLGVAVERVLGWPEGSFLAAYSLSRRESLEESLGGDSVGRAIVGLMHGRDEWRGTASDLLTALLPLAPSLEIKNGRWPKSSNWLSQRLDRLTAGLEAVGIMVSRIDYDAGVRKVIVLSRGDDGTLATQIANEDADAIASENSHAILTGSNITLAKRAISSSVFDQKEFNITDYTVDS